MRITEFDIHRYGPLSETGTVRLQSFNLFWGENEEGKTLIIEALIKMLLGKTRKLIDDIDRVNEDPNGYIIIEQADKSDAKIPEHGRIPDLVNLSAEECANLFIIRNSDLSIARESEFYGSVTERLTGLRSSQIQGVKRGLRNLGYLTESHQTVNDRNSQYLSNRLSKAAQLIEKCQALAKEAFEKKFDQLEVKLVSLTRGLETTNHEIQLQETARLREKFERGKDSIINLKKVHFKLNELKSYSDEKVTAWYQAEQVMRDEAEQVREFRKKIQSYQQEMEQNERLVAADENLLDIERKKQIRVEDILKPLFRKHRELSQKLTISILIKKFLNFMLLFNSVALLILIAGMIWKPGLATFLTAGILSTILILIIIIYFFKLIRPNRIIQRCNQDIFSQAGEFGFIGNGIPELQRQVQRFDDAIQVKEQKVLAINNRIHILRNRILELQQEHLVRSEKRLQTARQTIQRISVESGVNDLQEYRKKLQERKLQERVDTEAQSALRNLFDDFGDSTQMTGTTRLEQIKFWQSQVDELKGFDKEAPGVHFNERELERKRQIQNKLTAERHKTETQLEEFQESLSQIERETREVLLLEKNPYPCQNLTDLQVIIAKLKEFRHKIENKQKMAKDALAIFSEIENEEIQKVGALFGGDQAVSQYFKQITGSVYQEVHYDPVESQIRVKRRDDKMLSAKWLSGGAYDQLYFAIRLALGKELLQGQTGFFILDDPFIKSDHGRLKRMMDILVEISLHGWQILYFSAKDEVLDVLKENVEAKDVTLHQVPKSSLLMSEDE
jgi:exonuclease SbcC